MHTVVDGRWCREERQRLGPWRRRHLAIEGKIKAHEAVQRSTLHGVSHVPSAGGQAATAVRRSVDGSTDVRFQLQPVSPRLGFSSAIDRVAMLKPLCCLADRDQVGADADRFEEHRRRSRQQAAQGIYNHAVLLQNHDTVALHHTAQGKSLPGR